MVALDEEEVVKEEDSLDKELDASVSEQPSVDADQNVEGTNHGQKEASGGLADGSTAAEDTPAQVSPPRIQDLTEE